ncbi:MAG: FAD:protein FMN transferase [Candidatus Omnitrophica bacterium]|nr:FAD:protein FMN transferase [Candidatus Omnitrophota bacterium]
MKIRLLSLFILTVFCLCGCQNKQLFKETQIMLGTFVEVISPEKKAIEIAFKEIKRIEVLLSKYNPESEISKLNKLGKLKVSPQTFYIIKKAKEFSIKTGGAFDVTVGPLMELWGFTDKDYRLPKQEQIKETLKLIGSDKIILNDLDNTVEFAIPGMKIDLGGIAKGYAVDCAIKRLKEFQIKNCLINAGGDIFCLGDKFGRPWSVAIQDPEGKGFLKKLSLKDRAVATSGNYEQFFIKENKYYGHILNPKTGYPVDPDFKSVTVIASDCLTADALATAIFVLGKERYKDLIKEFKDIEVKIY